MTILNEMEVYTNSGFLDIVFLVGLVLGVAFVIGAIANLIEGEVGYAVGMFVAASLVALGLSQLSDTVFEQHTEYEVIVEDYNEIHEQGYEIVDTRGEITVIKKKEDN